MKYISEFRQPKLVEKIVQRIKRIAQNLEREIKLMEVCGTHAMMILRYGIKQLLPANIKLISGPGCPVCVTPDLYIDKACTYARKGFLIATFGDMMRVPGSNGSLIEEKSKGGKIKVVYSPVDALKLAESFPEEKVVFLGIGFETTAPTVAASVAIAKERKISNYMVLSGHKLIPPAMKALVQGGKVKIDGFLCPGHVSTIIGSKAYEFIAEDYHIPCVVAGFEPVDILQSIYLLLLQISQSEAKVENEYARSVSKEGNLTAKKIMSKVFTKSSSVWRGLGMIEESGLKLKEDYFQHDVEVRFPLEVFSSSVEDKGCRCGEILQGLIEPPQCPLFAKECNPSRPYGPCMVSVEGACNIYYRFGKDRCQDSEVKWKI